MNSFVINARNLYRERKKMFTGIQILKSKRNQWFKRGETKHNNSTEREEKKDTPNIANEDTPIIANRNTMSLESI